MIDDSSVKIHDVTGLYEWAWSKDVERSTMEVDGRKVASWYFDEERRVVVLETEAVGVAPKHPQES